MRAVNYDQLTGSLRKVVRKRVEPNSLLDNFESCALSVTRGRAVQQRPNRVNGLAVAADDATNVALTQLDPEDRHLAAGDFRKDHVVRKLDELANDELKKFLHRREINQTISARRFRSWGRRCFGCRFLGRGLWCLRRFRRRRWLRNPGGFFRSYRFSFLCGGLRVFVFLDQATHGVGRLSAFADPMLDPVELERAIIARLLGIVSANDLDKFSVAWTALVCDYHFKIRAVQRAFSS